MVGRFKLGEPLSGFVYSPGSNDGIYSPTLFRVKFTPTQDGSGYTQVFPVDSSNTGFAFDQAPYLNGTQQYGLLVVDGKADILAIPDIMFWPVDEVRWYSYGSEHYVAAATILQPDERQPDGTFSRFVIGRRITISTS